MTKKQFAETKGVTLAELNKIEMDFLQNEGYLDNGTECQTLGEYINARLKKQTKFIDENETAIIACEQGKICGAL